MCEVTNRLRDHIWVMSSHVGLQVADRNSAVNFGERVYCIVTSYARLVADAKVVARNWDYDEA